MPTPQALEAKFWKALGSMPSGAEIWLDEYSFVAGVKMLLGNDPNKDYQDKVAEVKLT